MAYVDFNDLILSAPEYFCLIKPLGTMVRQCVNPDRKMLLT